MDYKILIQNNLSEKHGRFDFYYSKNIDKIVKDQPNSRLVAIFKDYLIYDDCSCECLRRYYKTYEGMDKLSKLTDFYQDYADIFPSYALLLQPCQDEMSMILKEKEGMAKYMYKNIRRKQRIIDEKFSFKGGNNQDKIFFTPSFMHSVVKFEQNIIKRERVNYLRKIAFGLSISDLLDQFIEKDTQDIVDEQEFFVGRVIEPLHFVDNVFHVELENRLKQQLFQKKRSSSRSKSPLVSSRKFVPDINQKKANNVIANTNSAQKSRTTPAQSARIQMKTQTSPRQTHNISKQRSPSQTKTERNPVKQSAQLRSPMKNINNIGTPNNLLKKHEMLQSRITPHKEIKNTGIVQQSQHRQSQSPIFSPKLQIQNRSPVLPRQNGKPLISHKKSATNYKFNLPKSSIDENNQFATPNKNVIRTRDISGSKGRLQRNIPQNIQEVQIFDNQIINEESSKSITNLHSSIQAPSFVQGISMTTANKIRESIIKKPFVKQNHNPPNGRNHHQFSTIQCHEISEGQIISLNMFKESTLFNN
ncbi:UNKNOWN [Stylonychia lemnae]|uniref:Uncharacterized protein n=1 Tax=Stylonychia lemnae TaxID=5949 RepID=A0A078BAG4_STYLE|nr:UNKNOWN [Stylonychia lemnae]|eukprot:CDW91216.1 UNKNOWN [Stylonychia lemnae]